MFGLVQIICLATMMFIGGAMAITWVSECWVHVEDQFNNATDEEIEEWWS